MHCLADNAKGVCLETRKQARGVRRRYVCPTCSTRWSTLEVNADVGTTPQGRLLQIERERLTSLLEATNRALEQARQYLGATNVERRRLNRRSLEERRNVS